MIHRLRQVAASLASREPGGVPAELASAPRTARLFADLAPHDRRHLVAVHHDCVASGISREVATAGLLHDIGKASLSGRQVNLLDRTVRVVMARWRFDSLSVLGRAPAPGWRLGLVLAHRHAAFGADRLAALGWPESIVLAVREHESDAAEGERATLRRIDDATP